MWAAASNTIFRHDYPITALSNLIRNVVNGPPAHNGGIYKGGAKMHCAIKLKFLALTFLLVGAYGAWAMETSGLTITHTMLTPGVVNPGQSVLISCAVSHSGGRTSIDRVAATIFHGNKITTLPRLFDDGTHGDHTPDDGLYSLNVSAPLIPGQCKIIIYAVDKDRNEIESEPLFYTIE